jgi:hypothetical protein
MKIQNVSQFIGTFAMNNFFRLLNRLGMAVGSIHICIHDIVIFSTILRSYVRL